MALPSSKDMLTRVINAGGSMPVPSFPPVTSNIPRPVRAAAGEGGGAVGMEFEASAAPSIGVAEHDAAHLTSSNSGSDYSGSDKEEEEEDDEEEEDEDQDMEDFAHSSAQAASEKLHIKKTPKHLETCKEPASQSCCLLKGNDAQSSSAFHEAENRESSLVIENCVQEGDSQGVVSMEDEFQFPRSEPDNLESSLSLSTESKPNCLGLESLPVKSVQSKVEPADSAGLASKSLSSQGICIGTSLSCSSPTVGTLTPLTLPPASQIPAKQQSYPKSPPTHHRPPPDISGFKTPAQKRRRILDAPSVKSSLGARATGCSKFSRSSIVSPGFAVPLGVTHPDLTDKDLPLVSNAGLVDILANGFLTEPGSCCNSSGNPGLITQICHKAIKKALKDIREAAVPSSNEAGEEDLEKPSSLQSPSKKEESSGDHATTSELLGPADEHSFKTEQPRRFSELELQVALLTELAERESKLFLLQQHCYRLLKNVNLCFPAWGKHQASFLWHSTFIMSVISPKSLAPYCLIFEDISSEVTLRCKEAIQRATEMKQHKNVSRLNATISARTQNASVRSGVSGEKFPNSSAGPQDPHNAEDEAALKIPPEAASGLLTSLVFQTDALVMAQTLIQLDNLRRGHEPHSFEPLADLQDIMTTYTWSQSVHVTLQPPVNFVLGLSTKFKSTTDIGSSRAGKKKNLTVAQSVAASSLGNGNAAALRTKAKKGLIPKPGPHGETENNQPEGSSSRWKPGGPQLDSAVRQSSALGSASSYRGKATNDGNGNFNEGNVEPEEEWEESEGGCSSDNERAANNHARNATPSASRARSSLSPSQHRMSRHQNSTSQANHSNSNISIGASPVSDGLELPRDAEAFKSYVKGVYYDENSNRWCASWHERKTAKKKSKYFAVKKFGFHSAKTRAMDARLQAEESGECAPTNIN